MEITTKKIADLTGLNHQGIKRKVEKLDQRNVRLDNGLVYIKQRSAEQILSEFLQSPRVSSEKKQRIIEVLESFGKKADLNVVKENDTTKLLLSSPRMLFGALSVLILAQAYHFGALEATVSPGLKGFGYLVGLCFEGTALVLTINHQGRYRMAWLWGFAIVAVLTNILYYNPIGDELIEVITKVLVSVALPVSILAFSHLFARK